MSELLDKVAGLKQRLSARRPFSEDFRRTKLQNVLEASIENVKSFPVNASAGGLAMSAVTHSVRLTRRMLVWFRPVMAIAFKSLVSESQGSFSRLGCNRSIGFCHNVEGRAMKPTMTFGPLEFCSI